jgi:hypothetical protein
VALELNPDGEKEVLGLWIEQTEGAKFWLKVVNELKARGVNDIVIAVVDGLKGFPEAITGPATVSLGRVSKAGLGLVRLLAQNDSSRHSTIGICRWQCDAPDDSRFSRELRKNQFSCRIHHRPARYR